MKFSTTTLVPKQECALTPDVFVTDNYGKLIDSRSDGQLFVNNEVRMSRIVDKLLGAFVPKDDTLLYGCYLQKDTIKLSADGDLSFDITPGKGVIDERTFVIDTAIHVNWKGFSSNIPPNLSNGKIIIYLYFRDSISNTVNRPYRLNEPHYPTKKLPDTQYEWDPIQVRWIFYDESEKKVIGSMWEDDAHVIIITSELKYCKDNYGKVSIKFNEINRNEVEIGDLKYPQEGGGTNYFKEVDGGIISSLEDESLKPALGIHELLKVDQTAKNEYRLNKTPQNNLFVFVNGLLLSSSAYQLNDDHIQFMSLPRDSQLQIFEISHEVEAAGTIRNIYDETRLNKTYQLNLAGVNPNSNLLIWINGLLADKDSVTISEDMIEFRSPIMERLPISVNLVEKSTLIDIGVELLYRKKSEISGTNKIFVPKIQNREILVFYDGKLKYPSVDFMRQSDCLIFKNFTLSSNNEILILGV